MKKLIFIFSIFLTGCSNLISPEVQKKITENQQLINNSKEITIFYNSEEFHEIKVEDGTENNTTGLASAILYNEISKFIQNRNEKKSNKYTIDFNEKLKSLYEQQSMNNIFTETVAEKLKDRGYSVKLIKLDKNSIEKYENDDGLKVLLYISTGYISPKDSISFVPKALINYKVAYSSTYISKESIGGTGGWITDTYLTYNGLSSDSENARNKIKKYLMDDVDRIANKILTVDKRNIYIK